MLKDLVILVPGFFGFSRVSGFYYFADRVGAALRAALSPALGAPVPVVPVTTEPTASLVQRQELLLGQVQSILGKLRQDGAEIERLHLVCHSTGGVDACLLGRAHRADGSPWGPDDQSLRRLLRSVVTIAAPLQGTSLALTDVARFYETPQRPAHWPAAAEVAWRAVQLYVADGKDSVLKQFLNAAGADAQQTKRMLEGILLRRDLARDLRPDAMAQRWRDNPRDPGLQIRHRSFVTVGVRPYEQSDPLYTYLHGQIAAKAQRDAVAARALEIENARPPALRSPLSRARSPLPGEPITVQDNDGVVDSSRQLLLEQPDECAGLVLGDHADVLGRYDNIDHLMD